MKLVEFVRRLQEHPRLRPIWWRWLQAIPEPLREAERRARISFLLIQLPSALLLALVHAAAKHLGAFESQPLVGAWLAAAGVLILAWPVPWLRVGTTAMRAASSASARLASQLRAFAVLFYLLATVSFVSLAVVFGLLTLVSIPKVST